jgi:hypothetical protein
MATKFLRDSMDSKNPTLERRRFNDATAFVGAMVPVPPSILSGASTIGVSLASAIKNFASKDAIGLIGNVIALAGGTAEALNASGRQEAVIFQYFPENITDQRTNPIEYIAPPGLSLPVPTLAGASERLITMTLTFSCERWAGVGKRLAEWDKYNFDVAKCVQAVRSFAYPIGASVGGTKLTAGVSPQPFMLTLPGTLIGITSDTIGAVLNGYNVQYVSFFPDGQPRLAHVAVTMSEVTMNVTQNATGLVFTDLVKSVFNHATRAIQTKAADGSDRSKGIYGTTITNDVSTREGEIPPRGETPPR